MKKMIGLAGPSIGFLHRLTDYVNNQGEVAVFLCTREDVLEEEVERKEPVIMFMMKGFGEDVDLDVPKVNFVTEKEERGIYQFQSAESLYEAMRGYLRPENPARVMTEDKKEICAVYSPLGRSGKTSFALAYGKAHSFFYLGLEEYGFKTNDFCNEGQIFYHIKNRRTDLISLMLERVEYRDGVYVFGSPMFYGDIHSLNTEDMEWFLHELRTHDAVPSVMVDFGSGCLGDMEILDLFDQVFIPVLSGETEETKLRNFREILFEVNGRMEGKKQEIMVPEMCWMEPDFLNQVQYMEGLLYE